MPPRRRKADRGCSSWTSWRIHPECLIPLQLHSKLSLVVLTAPATFNLEKPKFHGTLECPTTVPSVVTLNGAHLGGFPVVTALKGCSVGKCGFRSSETRRDEGMARLKKELIGVREGTTQGPRLGVSEQKELRG